MRKAFYTTIPPRILRAHGFMDDNGPEQTAVDVPDDFNLTPGLFQFDLDLGFVPFIPPRIVPIDRTHPDTPANLVSFPAVRTELANLIIKLKDIGVLADGPPP